MHELSTVLVIRFIWDPAVRAWRVQIMPDSGRRTRVFPDLESAFFYITQLINPNPKTGSNSDYD